jgi:hypothetical protein
MKSLKPQYTKPEQKLIEAQIATEIARARNENAQAEIHLKQLEIISKKKTLVSRAVEQIGKATTKAAPYVISYLIGMSVLEKYNKVSQVQSENAELKGRVDAVVNDNHTLSAEISRFKGQNAVFFGNIPTNIQGAVFSSNEISGLTPSNSSVLTISSSSNLQIFEGQLPTSQFGQFTLNGSTNIVTPASINGLNLDQSKVLFRQQ